MATSCDFCTAQPSGAAVIVGLEDGSYSTWDTRINKPVKTAKGKLFTPGNFFMTSHTGTLKLFEYCCINFFVACTVLITIPGNNYVGLNIGS